MKLREYRSEKYEKAYCDKVTEDTIKIEEPVNHNTWPKPDYASDKSAVRAGMLWEL